VSISAGFTAEEIREFVYAYTAQPFGRKAQRLTELGVSYDRLRRWRLEVFDGDLDRRLTPGVSGPGKTTFGQRAAVERHHLKEPAVSTAREH
jgi:hypothetical protein